MVGARPPHGGCPRGAGQTEEPRGHPRGDRRIPDSIAPTAALHRGGMGAGGRSQLGSTPNSHLTPERGGETRRHPPRPERPDGLTAGSTPKKRRQMLPGSWPQANHPQTPVRAQGDKRPGTSTGPPGRPRVSAQGRAGDARDSQGVSPRGPRHRGEPASGQQLKPRRRGAALLVRGVGAHGPRRGDGRNLIATRQHTEPHAPRGGRPRRGAAASNSISTHSSTRRTDPPYIPTGCRSGGGSQTSVRRGVDLSK